MKTNQNPFNEGFFYAWIKSDNIYIRIKQKTMVSPALKKNSIIIITMFASVSALTYIFAADSLVSKICFLLHLGIILYSAVNSVLLFNSVEPWRDKAGCLILSLIPILIWLYVVIAI